MASNSQHIEQHISQQLQQRLSPQQVRFVRLLEMNRSEAEEAVERELADNPALEKVNEALPSAPTEDGSTFRESAEELQRKDYADPDDIPYYRLRQPSSGHAETFIPQTPDDADDLYSSLRAQLSELSLSSEVRYIAEYVIDSLDSNGYLTRTPVGIMSDLEIETGREIHRPQLEAALQAVRSLDPPGVGAESLQQNLLLQLDRHPQSEAVEDARKILADGWDMFLKRHNDRMSARLKLTPARTARALEVISRLNPKPGSTLGSGRGSRAADVVPDFIVDTDDNGHLNISLGGRQPHLAIEASFDSAMKMIQSGKSQRIKGADYIAARYGDARDFIALLQQRRDTLMAVITAIVSLQKEYFLSADDSTLRPMTLKDVAAITGHDPSTISRSTSGKYVQTRAGILPLRHFFSESYTGEDGAEISARQVEVALKKIVSEEDPRHPLSDEAICDRLTAAGYPVSRRTVAKYRDRLHIPVARLRRQ